jgi:hypothetical protein
MSALPYEIPLRAERGGLAPAIDLPRPRMTPAEIPLTLSADVLRLPYQPAVRMVLAEIVSLHAATAGRCDCSDAHFAARLTLSSNTVSRAVQQLEADKLITKHVNKAAGFHRTLTPDLLAIAEKAATNPYPQNAGSYPQNGGRGTTPKTGVAYPQNEGSPTPKMGGTLPPKWGSNTPFNIPSNFQEPSTSSADASPVAAEEKTVIVLPAENPDASASHTEGAAGNIAISQNKATDKKDRKDRTTDKTDKPSAENRAARADRKDKAEPEHFAAFWQAWPKKEKRKDALAAFAKLSADDQAAAASRADTWLAARPDLLDPTRYRYIPHATSWLNQTRWTDEAAPLTTTAHDNPTATAPYQRPANGAKPTANAAELASALFEQLAD